MSVELRNKIKARKPDFPRCDSNTKKNFGVWRRARGRHNKFRLNRAGNKSPSVGYGSPKNAKGLTRDGFNLVRVSKLDDLNGINVKNDLILLDANLGTRKKIVILERLSKLDARVFNLKDVNKFLNEIKTKFETKKKTKSKKEVVVEKKTEQPKTETVEDPKKKTRKKTESKK